ncbi:hypothetical protein [Pectobacterium versatile]|uniref:hypothetical protein n=1 Tax=Pectobacterium versatile TaxID=2488639 RepID=UPI0038030CBD
MRRLNEAVNSLIRNGQMDFDESSLLLSFMAPAALSKVVYDGIALASPRQPMNVFSKIQEGIDGALSRNEKAKRELALSYPFYLLYRMPCCPVSGFA